MLDYFFFTFTLCATVTLWLPLFRYSWLVFYGLAVCLGLLSEHLVFSALLSIVILWLSCILNRNGANKKTIIISECLLLVLAVGMLLHFFKGFENWKILSNISISNDSIPYSLYFNFDKATLAIFFGAYIVPLTKEGKRYKKIGLTILVFTTLAVCLLFPISYFSKYIRFDPKIPSFTLIWVLNNLFITAVSEEMFFRGFIQNRLIKYLPFSKGSSIAIIVTSLLFGLAHFPGGVSYVFIAMVAGGIYGLAYFVSKSIEASILTHFLVNAIHFFYFTYPALAR